MAPLYRWTHAKDVGAILHFFFAGLADTSGLRLATVSHGDPIADAPAAQVRALAPA
jgi:hypothetical protein